MTHLGERDSPCDWLASYSLDALDPPEREAFEAHLASGCPTCSREAPTWSAVVADLASLVNDAAPPPNLRRRVLERVAGDSETMIEKDGLWFARSGRIPWQAMPLEGLEIKLLSIDRERAVSTQLVRMAPGSSYPAHRHAGTEELFLLEGELLVSGVLMRAGDYCRAEPGTLHSDIRSEKGCLFLSTASLRDEILSSQT